MSDASIVQQAAEKPDCLHLIEQALSNTDARIASGKSVNPAFFLAVLLWHPMLEYKQRFIERGQHEMEALLSASHEVIMKQQAHTSIPKRFSLMMREIWHMQAQLQHPTRRRAMRTLTNKRFRAGYDFLMLRNSVGEFELSSVCRWWTEIQTKSEAEQKADCEALGRSQKRQGKHRRRHSSAKKTAGKRIDSGKLAASALGTGAGE